jgi:predicted deacylase
MKLLTLVSLCLFSAAQAASQTNFTVGSATAAPGQKAFGVIEVPAHADAAASIPVAVFHGAKPGPVLALVSGLHGTEYASIIALEKLIQSLDPGQISGTVMILPWSTFHPSSRRCRM